MHPNCNLQLIHEIVFTPCKGGLPRTMSWLGFQP